MGIGTFTIAELTAHGVALAIALVRTPENRLQYEVTAGRFRAVLPHCGCDRPACAGPGVWGRVCKRAEGKGADGFTHRRDFCHGGMSLWHEEHVQVYAAAVLATFGPKGRKYTLPKVRKSTYRPTDFIQLEGEHVVMIEPWTYGKPRRVICDAAHCRGLSHNLVLQETTDEDEAYRVRNEHIEWHRSLGEHPRVALGRWIAEHAMVTTPEPEPVSAEAAA